MSWNRRLMAAIGVGGSKPDYSSYRGVFIEDVDGYLYTVDGWDGSKTPNGVAVLTDNCRFVMALINAHTSSCKWSEDYGVTSGTTTTTYIDEAQTDYDGKQQTLKILSYFESFSSAKSAQAAYYCSAFTFPNGKKGYLGAAGEWQAAADNKAAIESALNKCGGSSMGVLYWTSTQYDSETSWSMNWDTKLLFDSFMLNLSNARAFTTLKSDEWSEGGGDEGGEGDSSTANIYWETQSGVWNKDIDSSGNETYTCESPGDSGSTVIRCYFSGVTSITFRCVSRGENNYDYLTIGEYDDYCTRDYYKESLKGKNGVITDVTYICNKADHYVEFCYSKDGSDSVSPDNATVYVASYSTE